MEHGRIDPIPFNFLKENSRHCFVSPFEFGDMSEFMSNDVECIEVVFVIGIRECKNQIGVVDDM
ncbi:hypothetical protein OZ13_11675 [Xanthomonas cannabis pv. cannabis]|nr:hypothetical protein OZ13_11675 [Xanthomonas cannabis pv. cannabis]